MGFMGIRDWGQSDSAANFQYKLERDINFMFKKELKDEGNCYNTPGWLNALLIFKTYPSLVHFVEDDVAKKIRARITRDKEERGYLHLAGGKALVDNFEKLLKERGKV